MKRPQNWKKMSYWFWCLMFSQFYYKFLCPFQKTQTLICWPIWAPNFWPMFFRQHLFEYFWFFFAFFTSAEWRLCDVRTGGGGQGLNGCQRCIISLYNLHSMLSKSFTPHWPNHTNYFGASQWTRKVQRFTAVDH